MSSLLNSSFESIAIPAPRPLTQTESLNPSASAHLFAPWVCSTSALFTLRSFAARSSTSDFIPFACIHAFVVRSWNAFGSVNSREGFTKLAIGSSGATNCSAVEICEKAWERYDVCFKPKLTAASV
jgi:hypothetical protein